MIKIKIRAESLTYDSENNEFTILLRPKSKFTLMPSGIMQGVNVITPLNLHAADIYSFIVSRFGKEK